MIKCVNTIKAPYLADIFNAINELNKKLQGETITLIKCKSMITSFVKAFFLQTKSGPKHSIPVSKSRQECCYRGGMAEILLACRNPSERYENSLCWSCWPLGSKLDTHAIFCKTWDIRVELQEQLIDLQYDNEFKVFFKKDHYDLFWCQIVDKYHLLWKEPRMWVLSFPTSYLVVKGLSAVILMLSQQGNCL